MKNTLALFVLTMVAALLLSGCTLHGDWELRLQGTATRTPAGFGWIRYWLGNAGKGECQGVCLGLAQLLALPSFEFRPKRGVYETLHNRRNSCPDDASGRRL